MRMWNWIALCLLGYPATALGGNTVSAERRWDLPIPAAVFASSVDSEEGEEDGDERESPGFDSAPGGIPVGSRLLLTLGADFEVTRVEAGDNVSYETVFDEIRLGLSREGWIAETALQYDTDSGISVDEASLRLSPAEPFLSWVRVGKAALPFGEMDGVFLSDPLVVELGETIAKSVVVGTEWESVDLSAGLFRAGPEKESRVAGVAALEVLLPLGGTFLAGWTSSIEESQVLQDLRGESPSPGDLTTSTGSAGWNVGVAFEAEPWTVRGGCLWADRSLRGYLEAGKRRPWAWSADVVCRVTGRTAVSLRADGSEELPGAPRARGGLAVTQQVTGNLRVGLEALAVAAAGDRMRELAAGLQLSLDF